MLRRGLNRCRVNSGERTVPDQTVPLWVTIVSSLSVGSFVGGLITQLFSSRQQHQEWLKDNKKEEWRELISTLSQSFQYLKNNTGYGVVKNPEQQKGAVEADAEARRAIESRIFVAQQIQRENLLERWKLLAAEGDWSKRAHDWNSLHDTLVVAAHKDLGIGISFWKRWFGG